MPLISDLLIKKEPNKRFKKTPYRPWDNEETADPTQEEVKDNRIELLSSDNNSLEADKKTINPSINKNSSSITSTLTSPSTEILLSTLETYQFLDQNLEKEFRRLFGAEKTILEHLLKLAEERSDEYVITKSITIDEFASSCNLPPNTVKTMLQKLKHKKFLLKHESKPGRGGYARYRIFKKVYNFFMKRCFPEKALD
jgi:predicted transcriptional regulator